MDFMYIDSSNSTEEELIEALNCNRHVALLKKDEIKKLKNATSSDIIEIKKVEPIVFVKTEQEAKKDLVNDFEEEVDYYMNEIRNLDNKDDIASVLPSRLNYNYRRIILRIMAEFTRDIKEINEILTTDSNDMSRSELKEYKQEIVDLSHLCDLLRKALEEEKTSEEEEKHENTMIFVPTSSGNIRVLDEIEAIPRDYYDDFLELFTSIKNGSFKNIRRFVNSNILNGALEVKGFKVRVLFVRITGDFYAIISAFVKKSDNDKGYRLQIENKYAEYKKIADELKKNLFNEEFIKLNNQYQEELFRLLGDTSTKKEVIK